ADPRGPFPDRDAPSKLEVIKGHSSTKENLPAPANRKRNLLFLINSNPPLPQFLHNAFDLIRRVLFLARPYGRKKLAVVSFLSLAQGVFQVIGVTSIFPFLAIAADPERIRNSQFGRRFLELLPPMDNRQLLLTAGAVAIVALFTANAVNLIAEYARTRYAHNFGHWLRVRLLWRIASRPYGYFLVRNSADLIKK